jgi:hypothetical protein
MLDRSGLQCQPAFAGALVDDDHCRSHALLLRGSDQRGGWLVTPQETDPDPQQKIWMSGPNASRSLVTCLRTSYAVVPGAHLGASRAAPAHTGPNTAGTNTKDVSSFRMRRCCRESCRPATPHVWS